MTRAALSSYMHIFPHYQQVTQAHLKSTKSVPNIDPQSTLGLRRDHQRRRSYTPAYPPAPPHVPAVEVAVAAGGTGGDDGSDADESRTSVCCRAAEEPAGLIHEAGVDDAANDGKKEYAVADTTAMGEGTPTSSAEGKIDLVGPHDGNEHLQSRLQELADASDQSVHVLEETWAHIGRVGDRTPSIDAISTPIPYTPLSPSFYPSPGPSASASPSIYASSNHFPPFYSSLPHPVSYTAASHAASQSSSSSSSYSSPSAYSYADFNSSSGSEDPPPRPGNGHDSFGNPGSGSNSNHNSFEESPGSSVASGINTAGACMTDITGPAAIALGGDQEEEEDEGDGRERVAEIEQISAEIDATMEKVIAAWADGEMEWVKSLS